MRHEHSETWQAKAFDEAPVHVEGVNLVTVEVASKAEAIDAASDLAARFLGATVVIERYESTYTEWIVTPGGAA